MMTLVDFMASGENIFFLFVCGKKNTHVYMEPCANK